VEGWGWQPHTLLTHTLHRSTPHGKLHRRACNSLCTCAWLPARADELHPPPASSNTYRMDLSSARMSTAVVDSDISGDLF
jgi:hypothetical protein